MRIISRQTFIQFARKYADAKEALDAWYHDVKKSDWASWTDIKRQYPTASPIGNDRYVFNIKGNHYKNIVIVKFCSRTVYIRLVGTHKEYDSINAAEV